MADAPDPTALFRQMVGEWEKFANSVGGNVAKSDQFSQALHGANAATMQIQEAIKAAMERALAAANMPSRDEVADLSARLARVEVSLGRIEVNIAALAGGTQKRNDRPRPSRTRTPPTGG